MAEGTLTVNLQTLQTSLQGLAALGTGFAGAANLAATSPGAGLQGFAQALLQQMSGALHFEASASVSGAQGLFGSLSLELQASPAGALAELGQQIEAAGGAFSLDLVNRLQGALDTLRKLSAGVPQDRTAVAGALLEQILNVLGSLRGPEAAQIEAWVRAVEEQRRVLMPVIEQAQNAADPAAFAVQVVEQSLRNTLELFGLPRLQELIDFLDGLPGIALPQAGIGGADAALTVVAGAYSQTLSVAAADYPVFRDSAVAAYEAMEDLKLTLRPVLGSLRRLAALPIFQPGALETFLRQRMEDALGAEVREVQKIDDPFKALLDRIDKAIEGIDLSVVRNEVLGFFESTRAAIESASLPSLGDTLQEQLAPAKEAIDGLQQGAAGAVAKVEKFFADLAGRFRTLAAGVGEFQPDGTFRFHVERDLRQALRAARIAIGGDPENPGAPSVAGTLAGFQTTIDQFLSQLQGLIEPLSGEVSTVTEGAVQGIEDFTAFLQGLDLPALMTQLQAKVQEIVDALLPIDFSAVVDPVVEEIEEGAAKLREIDSSSLNDMLRAALSAALEVVIDIDFSVAISAPLSDKFAEVKAVPALAIAELQKRYEEATALLHSLAPDQLLAALFASFDVIGKAIGALDVANLLKPLDDVYEQSLQEPLAALKPSVLLKPLSDAFQKSLKVLDPVRGTELIAPLNEGLATLKTAVAGLDPGAWIGDLLAEVERIQQAVREIKPSAVLTPLIEDFARLEAELDRFKPSVLFQPVVELAAPLLSLLEGIQAQAVTTLFNLFQAPLKALDRIRPDALSKEIQDKIDAVIKTVESLKLTARYNQLKGQFFDLKAAVQTDSVRVSISVQLIDPQRHLGELMAAYDTFLAALRGLKQNVQLPALQPLYDEMRERVLGLLPPYARELLDPETFKRVMRLADPTRFLTELDARFETLKNKLIPIRPQDIAAELDAAHESLLALVEGLDLEGALNQVKDTLSEIQEIAAGLRVDFLAADVDRVVGDLKKVLAAVDVSRLFGELDALHHEVELVVESARPSQVLGGLQPALDEVKGLVTAIDPAATLGPPLQAAWGPVEDLLAGVDFTVILKPLVDKLDELEAEFTVVLEKAEDAFDEMLAAGRSALGGGGSVSISVGGSFG